MTTRPAPLHSTLIVAILIAGVLDFAANWLAAHYLIAAGPFLIPAGTFCFAVAFTVYDFIRRQGGIVPTLAAVLLGFGVSVAYTMLFGGGVARIALAGLIALACSSTMDLLMQTVTLRWPVWAYVGASNAVSLLIDTIVFVTVAFAMLPVDIQLRLVEGQYLAKVLMTALGIPLVYGARAWLPTRQPSARFEAASAGSGRA